MKLLLHLTLLALPIFLASCENNPAPAAATEKTTADAEQEIIGTWEVVELDITFHTYQKQDTNYHQVIQEADWQRRYGVRPPRTEFTPDGKHQRTHRLEGGQIADVTNGLWKVQGTDSLFIIEPNIVSYYAYNFDGNKLVLMGVVDADYDGEADDEYRSEMRLVSRTQ